MPALYSLQVYRGDTHRWQFRFWADAAKTVPQDLSDVTPTAEIRNGDALVATLACVVTLPNVLDLELTAEEAAKLRAPAFHWDLQFLYPDDVVRTPLAGAVDVTADATL